MDKCFHKRIASLCIQHFNTLPTSGKPLQKEWTVLSCIVLEFNDKLNVIALGTGSKCIGNNKLSNSGYILNDSHAEVICRRSFLRFLYYEMKTINDGTCLDFNPKTGKFFIKKGVKFHFFTSQVPCGDAAIFAKPRIEDFGTVITQGAFNKKDDNDTYTVPSKKVKHNEECDTFRTGAKCFPEDNMQDKKLAGSGYHILGAVRLKPGRGEPTLSVSCSDKLLKWCNIGIQGALLSLLLEEPIYLSTFTVAANTPFSKEALERALFDRLENTTFKPHLKNKLVIEQSTLEFEFSKHAEKEACPSSISWSAVIEPRIEVAVQGRKQGVTKKNANKPAGRLKICKLELFKLFGEVCEAYDLTFGKDCDMKTMSYKDAKFLAHDYQNRWKSLREALKIWTVKDSDLLNFSIK